MLNQPKHVGMLESRERSNLFYSWSKQHSFTNSCQFLTLVSLCRAKLRTYDANLVLFSWAISCLHVINFLKIESERDKNGNTNITISFIPFQEIVLFQMISSFFFLLNFFFSVKWLVNICKLLTVLAKQHVKQSLINLNTHHK